MITEGFVTDPVVLARPSRELDLPTERALAREVVQELQRRMAELNSEQSRCAGLAAPQIDAPVRVCVLASFQPPLLNPRLENASVETSRMAEGCFSVPGSVGADGSVVVVERPRSVEVRYQTFAGEWRHARFRGFEARVVLHELDHLDGTLIVDKAAS